jgi:hypothetical protein
LVISLVKINKSLCYVTQGGGGGEEKLHRMSHGGGGGLKSVEKCPVLFEWPLSIFALNKLLPSFFRETTTKNFFTKEGCNQKNLEKAQQTKNKIPRKK